MHVIDVASEFTKTPGARFRADGDFSGEEFREKFLEPLFQNPADDSQITIVFDGAAGYATSFLEETFGGLARRFGKERCLKRLQFVSNEDPLLAKEIQNYIESSNGG